jgi:hypothetical protein
MCFSLFHMKCQPPAEDLYLCSTFSSLLYCHPEELVLRYTQELLFSKPQLFTNVITFVVNIFYSHVVSFNNRLQFLFFQHYIIHWKFRIVTNYILIVWKYFIFVVSMEITKKNQSYVVIRYLR